MQPEDGRFRHDLAVRSGVDWNDRSSPHLAVRRCRREGQLRDEAPSGHRLLGNSPSPECPQPPPPAPPRAPAPDRPAPHQRLGPARLTGRTVSKEPQTLIISLCASGGFFTSQRSAAFAVAHRLGTPAHLAGRQRQRVPAPWKVAFADLNDAGVSLHLDFGHCRQ
jgi:hypothetical protein